MAISKVRLPDSTEHSLNADLLDGLEGAQYLPTRAYNFSNGYLCTTDMPNTVSSFFLVEIYGKAHTNTAGPYIMYVQAYWAANSTTFNGARAIALDSKLDSISLFINEDGYICLWFSHAMAYSTFLVNVVSMNSGTTHNRVVSITNAAFPSTYTERIDLTPQGPKDSRLPDVTTNDAGDVLSVNSSGVWETGHPSGMFAYDERRIITNTSCPLYRYKICGINRRGTLVPLTITNQTSTTIVDKTPTTEGFDPQRGLVYYAGTDDYTTNSNSVWHLYYERNRIDTRYTFNTEISTSREVYLKGTYDGHTFSLDTTTHTSWYVQAQLATAAVSQFIAAFETGSYYMYVGTVGRTANKLHLAPINPLYYFDGTYLVQVNLDFRIDSVPTENSTNPITSGAVYTALGDIETLINAL